jgi:hypothetical protein
MPGARRARSRPRPRALARGLSLPRACKHLDRGKLLRPAAPGHVDRGQVPRGASWRTSTASKRLGPAFFAHPHAARCLGGATRGNQLARNASVRRVLHIDLVQDASTRHFEHENVLQLPRRGSSSTSTSARPPSTRHFEDFHVPDPPRAGIFCKLSWCKTPRRGVSSTKTSSGCLDEAPRARQRPPAASTRLLEHVNVLPIASVRHFEGLPCA